MYDEDEEEFRRQDAFNGDIIEQCLGNEIRNILDINNPIQPFQMFPERNDNSSDGEIQFMNQDLGMRQQQVFQPEEYHENPDQAIQKKQQQQDLQQSKKPKKKARRIKNPRKKNLKRRKRAQVEDEDEEDQNDQDFNIKRQTRRNKKQPQKNKNSQKTKEDRNLKTISKITFKMINELEQITYPDLWDRIMEYFDFADPQKIKRRLYDAINVLTSANFMYANKDKKFRIFYSKQYVRSLPLEQQRALIRSHDKLLSHSQQKNLHRSRSRRNKKTNNKKTRKPKRKLMDQIYYESQEQEQQNDMEPQIVRPQDENVEQNRERFTVNQAFFDFQYLQSVRDKKILQQTIESVKLRKKKLQQLKEKKQRLLLMRNGLYNLVQRNRKQIEEKKKQINEEQKIYFPLVVVQVDQPSDIYRYQIKNEQEEINIILKMNIPDLKRMCADLDCVRLLEQSYFKKKAEIQRFQNLKIQQQPIYQEQQQQQQQYQQQDQYQQAQ